MEWGVRPKFRTGQYLPVLLYFPLFVLYQRKEPRSVEDLGLRYVKYLHYYCILPSRISFYWFTALLWLGYRRPLEEEDLGYLPAEERTRFQCERFQRVYDAEKVREVLFYGFCTYMCRS